MVWTLKEDAVVYWKVEAVTFVFVVICIFLSFYFAFLSFQTFNESFRKQLVAFAASFLIAGLVIFVALSVHVGIKKALLRIENAVEGEDSSLANNRG